jgi:NADPH:quinone reductase-like Zn-dependent oxidoreductase
MTTMNAAVVTSFDEPPHYRGFETPTPHGEHEVLAEVLAAGLHPRVRSGASGSHYTSTGTLPMVPGVDAVARLADGSLVYFISDDDRVGTMAERTVIDLRRAIPLPEDADVARIAASMNPAMSSWVALHARVEMTPGASVLILGATGSAGRAAVQVARRLGAGRIVGAGRDPERLEAVTRLGADAVIQLTDDADATARAFAQTAAEVDVVIDYLWAAPAALAMSAILHARADRSRRLDWVQIGSMAGSDITLPSALFRSANLHVVGNGQGSVSPAGYRAQLPALAAEVQAGTIGVEPRTEPLADVERAWTERELPGERVVLVP